MSDELNPDQKKAAKFKDGVCAVIAVPGSGKTRTMMERIGILVNDHGIPPEAILGLTFTRNAADEMRHRLVPVLGDLSSRVFLATIHSFCFNLLKMEGVAFEILSGKGPDPVYPGCDEESQIQGPCHRDGLKGNFTCQKQSDNNR